VLAGTVRAMSLAVFDIDGVVADVRHRLGHLEKPHKDWSAFFREAASDPPLEAGLALVAELGLRHDVVWLTGRPEWLREQTRAWLAHHGLPDQELHLRAVGDYRPARVYKLGMLRQLAARSISAFVDDDPEVVEVALQNGYPAVLADWVPRSDTLQAAQERLGRT
jgi:hypothetical protein